MIEQQSETPELPFHGWEWGNFGSRVSWVHHLAKFPDVSVSDRQRIFLKLFALGRLHVAAWRVHRFVSVEVEGGVGMRLQALLVPEKVDLGHEMVVKQGCSALCYSTL